MSDTNHGGERRRPSEEELLSAVPRGTGGREAKLGLFVLMGLLSFVVVLYWMTDPATFRRRYMLVTTVTNAGGIRVADPVQMNGVIVGRINDFEMVGAGRVDIIMEIERKWEVPVGSVARLGAAGLFGGRALEILPSAASEYYEQWDTLASQPTGADDLLATAGELGARAGTVLESIDRLLDPETIGSVQGSARELEKLLADLSTVTREQRGALQRLTESLTRSAEGLEEAAAAGPDVAHVIARADTALSVLTETGTNLDLALASLRSLLERIDRGEGTLGRLAQDDALYESLIGAAESITTLMDDIRANPGRYINVSIF